ncbi:hypothetical protein [Sphingomonas endolithica]|nr:hypothetical protein [Sphingomonas sp. ZFBP2030]
MSDLPKFAAIVLLTFEVEAVSIFDQVPSMQRLLRRRGQTGAEHEGG